MAQKYNPAYQKAIDIVDDWAKQFKRNLSNDAYESLVNSIANEIENVQPQHRPHPWHPWNNNGLRWSAR